MTQTATDKAWSKTEFEQRLRDLGKRYHIHHPYHQKMKAGELTKAQIQGWVINRYYYQITIPRKDAALMANCPDREVRRHWVQRIIDHDGTQDQIGGIEWWVQLGVATGLKPEQITSLEGVLPGVRFAVDAYLNFVRHAPWQEAAASSLTELFAPVIHGERLNSWPEKYPWIKQEGLQYFRNRLTEAPRDVERGLEITLNYFTRRDQQQHIMNILQFKLDILWTMLDAMTMAYIYEQPPYFCVES